ncbi:MAG: hypothetical protein ACLGG0_09700 [Bacteriovoracia bacterium]
MKSLLLAITLMSTVPAIACELKFSRDDRPFDGALTELTIKKKDFAKGARVKLRSEWVSRMVGGVVHRVDFDQRGMECVVTGENSQVDLVSCVRDDRPVDGAKVEIIIKKNERETFDVTKITTILSRMSGESISQEDLAENLKLN